MSETIYSFPAPYVVDQMIEVYGDREMGWYEWRIVSLDDAVLADSGRDGAQGRQYGVPEIALRDALIAATSDNK